MMKRTMVGLIGSVAFGLMITGAAFASEHEGYEYNHGYNSYGSGYGYNDDMYEHGRGRIAIPAYSNVMPTVPAVVYPPSTVSNYRAAVPTMPSYFGHESSEYSGRYGYADDDGYRYRGGYGEHD